MKILVTGGAGYIGSALVRRLVKAGHAVVNIDNLSSGQRSSVPEGAIFIKGDIGDRSLLRENFRSHRFDAVFHLAADCEVEGSVLEPRRYEQNNTENSVVVFDACIEFGVTKLVFASTAMVYGALLPEAVTESHPLNPTNPYGESKMRAENLFREVCESSVGKLRGVILRYFNVAGACRDFGGGGVRSAAPHSSRLMQALAEVVLGERTYVAVNGTDYPTPDGTAIRDYVSLEDAVEANLAALRYLDRENVSGCEVFNVGSGHPHSVREVIAAMSRVAGCEIRVRNAGRRRGDLARLVADIERAKAILGWRPEIDDIEVMCRTALGNEMHRRS